MWRRLGILGLRSPSPSNTTSFQLLRYYIVNCVYFPAALDINAAAGNSQFSAVQIGIVLIIWQIFRVLALMMLDPGHLLSLII